MIEILKKILGPRTLQEYEIQKEVLETKSINNVGHTSIKFVFRRRIEYHITKTFVQVCDITAYYTSRFGCCTNIYDAKKFQTFILTMIGYLSFYFDLENFTDRAMVVLTTML